MALRTASTDRAAERTCGIAGVSPGREHAIGLLTGLASEKMDRNGQPNVWAVRRA